MKNLYEVLKESNKDLTTEQFSVYIHNILANSKGVLSETEIESLLDGTLGLFKTLAKDEMQRCNELNTCPNMTIDTYDFLQEHKEIQVSNYTPKQLEEMAEIDKKVKQLGEYCVFPYKKGTGISFVESIEIKKGLDSRTHYQPFYEAETIYDAYIGMFNQLKFAGVIFKFLKDGYKNFKWDGENFKLVSTTKYPIKNKEYDFLKQHKEIIPEDYTSMELDKMAEIDEKFRQLGEYNFKQSSLQNWYSIQFHDSLQFKTNKEILNKLSDWNGNFYLLYLNTFEELKTFKYIINHDKENSKYVWDGENFVPYSENSLSLSTKAEQNEPVNIKVNVTGDYSKAIQKKIEKLIVDHWLDIFSDKKINMDEVENIVAKDIKEACLKSYNKSLEKHTVSVDGTPAKNKVDIKIESDKSSEATAEGIKKAIDKYFKDLGINFDNLQVNEKEKPSISIKGFLINEALESKTKKFQTDLINYIDKQLDVLAKIITHKIDSFEMNLTMEEAKKDIDTLVKLRDKINVKLEGFMNITELDILNALNSTSIISNYASIGSFKNLKTRMI